MKRPWNSAPRICIGQVSPSACRGKRQRPMPSSSVSPVKIAIGLVPDMRGQACVGQSACASGPDDAVRAVLFELQAIATVDQAILVAPLVSRMIGIRSSGLAPVRTHLGTRRWFPKPRICRRFSTNGWREAVPHHCAPPGLLIAEASIATTGWPVPARRAALHAARRRCRCGFALWPSIFIFHDRFARQLLWLQQGRQISGPHTVPPLLGKAAFRSAIRFAWT